MIYKGEICGQWMNRDEFDNKFDEVMSGCDRRAERASDPWERRLAEAERRGAMRVVYAAASLWATGILCRAVPVYNLGIVDQLTGLGGSNPSEGLLTGEPTPGNGGGEDR